MFMTSNSLFLYTKMTRAFEENVSNFLPVMDVCSEGEHNQRIISRIIFSYYFLLLGTWICARVKTSLIVYKRTNMAPRVGKNFEVMFRAASKTSRCGVRVYSVLVLCDVFNLEPAAINCLY